MNIKQNKKKIIVLASVAIVIGFVLFTPFSFPVVETLKSVDNVHYVLYKYHGLPNDPSVTATGWQYQSSLSNVTYQVYTFDSHNLIVNQMGVTWVANKLFTSSYENTSTIAQYVGISTSSAAPAYTDTSLASEQTGTGLARATCTTLTLNSASSGLITATCVITFTNNTGGAVTSLQKAAWFINSVAHCAVTTPTGNGCIFAENTFASTNLNPSDAIQLTWKTNIQG